MTAYKFNFAWQSPYGHIVRMIERTLGARLDRRTLPDFNYAQPAPPKQ